jgi:hypothetical protein
MVCISKEEGGLGFLNLRTQNECLLLKHLNKFFNRVNVSWVQLVWNRYYSDGKLPRLTFNFRGSFWWRDLLKLLDPFKGMVPPISFGLIFGKGRYCNILFHSFSHFAEIHLFQSR